MNDADIREVEQAIRVLVVEDEYFIANDIVRALDRCGAEVIGPTGDPERALKLVGSSGRISAAILDICLGGAEVYALARELKARGIPFTFATGYDQMGVHPEFRDAPR